MSCFVEEAMGKDDHGGGTHKTDSYFLDPVQRDRIVIWPMAAYNASGKCSWMLLKQGMN